jgi:hypothetical protein
LAFNFTEDRMRTSKNLIALATLSLAAFAALPARANTLFATSRFQISFPDGWQPLIPVGPNDSLMVLYSEASMASSWISVHTTDHPMTAAEIDAYREVFTGTANSTKVSDGTKSLGGKSYTYFEYEADDTTDGRERTRIYYMASGSLLFAGSVSYELADASAAVADMEAALATLSLAGTPIRALAPSPFAGLRPADHDILGRARALSARTWLYRLPSR